MSKSEQVQQEGEAVPPSQPGPAPTVLSVPPVPTAPLHPPTLTPAQEMLLAFLREHDADCPVCGYNVRALTRPICPECKQELALTVGTARLRMGWLFAAVAPGFFSGIAALFVLIPTLGRPLFGDGRWEPVIVALDLFGWCSGVCAIVIATKRHRFLAQPRARQRWIALAIWFIHIAALGLFIFIAAVYL